MPDLPPPVAAMPERLRFNPHEARSDVVQPRPRASEDTRLGGASRSCARRLEWSAASDASLIGGVAAADPGALAEVFERHSLMMRALALRFSRGEDADDVVQDVLLRLWQRPEVFDPERGSLHTYLMMAVHGRAIDLFRSATSRRGREETVEAARQRSPYRNASIPADRPDQETWGLLSRLPLHQSEPIALAFFIGLTYCEVAASLGVPEGTIKTRIRTGLSQMHALILQDRAGHSDEDDEPGPET